MYLFLIMSVWQRNPNRIFLICDASTSDTEMFKISNFNHFFNFLNEISVPICLILIHKIYWHSCSKTFTVLFQRAKLFLLVSLILHPKVWDVLPSLRKLYYCKHMDTGGAFASHWGNSVPLAGVTAKPALIITYLPILETEWLTQLVWYCEIDATY